MMEMKFNSQICTTREQSERLLSLGLKKETADMCYRYVNTVKGEKKYELIVEAAWSQEVIDEYVRFGTEIGLFDNLVHPCGKPVTPLEARADVTKNDIPAWSLHRLIEMMPTLIGWRGRQYWLDINDDGVCYHTNANYALVEFIADNLYDNIVNAIFFKHSARKFLEKYRNVF
jgi:hypothetical protein